MSSGPKFTIKTLGCKANQYDSQVIREELLRRDFVESHGGKADLCIVNTCTVTAQSDAKSRQAIRALRRQNPSSRVVVTGCYAHMRPHEVQAMGEVDLVMDNPSKEILPDRVCQLLGMQGPFSPPRLPGISFFAGHTRAFVKIQDGCHKKCSYCVVRLARGRSRSRPFNEILGEIRDLVVNGYREVVLTGIHIGSFGNDDGDRENGLPDLLRALRQIQGLVRVRLSSIDPNEISEGLIAAVRESPQVCNHLHVPLQSGSDRILRAMNRDYTCEGFLGTVRWLKKELPHFSVSTDVMVGFPGETDEDFEESGRAISEAEFSKVHIFPFSSRPGTPAERLAGHLPPRIIKERAARLSQEARAAALRRRGILRGQKVEVLVEREWRLMGTDRLPPFLKNADAVYEGFSRNYLRTVFSRKEGGIESPQNSIVEVRVEDFDEQYLYGREV